ncbi:hypothetical protein [Aliikangiella maris]
MKKLILTLMLSISFFASQVNSAQVTYDYLNKTLNEIKGWAGSYASPWVYYDRNVCGERYGITAYVCGNYLQLGTQFLQNLENRYPLVAKGIFAHEWGHSIQNKRNIRYNVPYQELQSDCFSGSFTYYGENTLGYRGLYNSTSMSAYNAGDATHGTGSQRQYYVRKGYNTRGNPNGCF